MSGPAPHLPPADDAEHPFSEIAGYRLMRLLGSGGFAGTYLAGKGGRFYAVKVFHELPTGVDAQRFDHEVETLQLEHPNLVRYEDSGIVPFLGAKRAFIAMPYVPGRTLREAIDAEGPLPEDLARRIGAAVAEGLAFLHGHNIAHRDLTAKNIFLTDDGGVLILDFGLVKLMDRTSLTRDSRIPGTLPYCAPEQLRNQADLHTDLYGLGVTMYEVLTARLPFVASNLLTLVKMIEEEDPEPPSAHRPSLSSDLDELVLALLAKEPVQRPAAAEAVAERLRRVEPDPRAIRAPYERGSTPILAIRATTPSAAKAVIGAAMSGAVPDIAVGAITQPEVLAELVRAAGFDPSMRLIVDTKVETTAMLGMPKAVTRRAYAPENDEPYSDADLRAPATGKRVAREDIDEQIREGATALRTACFSFRGPDDPWIKRDRRILGDQQHARDAIDADAPLYATIRCDIDGLARRDDRISIANRFCRGEPQGFWVEIEGLQADSKPEVIAADLEFLLVLQEQGVPVIASLPGGLVELAWSVGVGGAEVKLGRVGGSHSTTLRVPHNADPRPRFEFTSLFESFRPEDAVVLLGVDALPEASCGCATCRLASEPSARVALADDHGLASWLRLREELAGMAISERVERLRRRLDEAEELLADARKVLPRGRGSARRVRNLRAALDLLEQHGLLEPMEKLRRVA